MYLSIHFAALVPYGSELFSNRGVLPDARLNLTFGILPNFLEHYDSPTIVTAFLLALSMLAVAFALGRFRRSAALLLWYGWACLFNRNNLINNPSIPYIGILLVLTTLVPLGEHLSSESFNREWKFPRIVYWTAWILMATGYSYSGWMKVHSPSWVDGTALYHVLNNPLARPGLVRDAMLALPSPCLRALTWVSLAAEAVFLPLSLTQRGRIVAWSALAAMNIGIVFVINFTDLTIGMLLLHLFTFDTDWIRHSRIVTPTIRTEVLHALRMLAFHPTCLDGAGSVRLGFTSAERDKKNSAD